MEPMIVLKRIYGDRYTSHNFSTITSSATFGGTILGMLIFGYLSDKMGRKFGMVSMVSYRYVFHQLMIIPAGRCWYRHHFLWTLICISGRAWGFQRVDCNVDHDAVSIIRSHINVVQYH